MKNYKYKKDKAGFSIFLAVIIIAALLLITFSVINVSVKESEFSSLNRESQYAIFAADAGIECAIYWDSKPAVSKFDPAISGSSIDCNGDTITTGSQNPIQGSTTISRIGGGGADTKSVFGFSLSSPLNPTVACVNVIVNKNIDGTTKINSYGYNNCSPSDPRRVERGIEVNY